MSLVDFMPPLSLSLNSPKLLAMYLSKYTLHLSNLTQYFYTFELLTSFDNITYQVVVSTPLQFSQHVIEMYVKMVELADNMYYRIFATVFQDSVDRFVRVRKP